MPTTINTPRDSTLKTTEQTPRNIADVLADELSGIAQALGGSTDYDDLTHRPEINSVTLTGDKSSGDLGLAGQEDLTNIVATGTTNSTGATILKGTYFYLNDDLCQAKADIASGATFTENTNYEEVTAGGLNALNSNITTLSNRVDANTRGSAVSILSYTSSSNAYTFPNDGYVTVKSGDTQGDYCTARIAGAIDISAKTQTTNYNEYNSLFVKKGMKVYILAKSGNTSTANYYPITSGS